MAGDNLVELRFRLSDGTDIGPIRYPPNTTVANLKQSILAQWPSEKENLVCPRTISDMKLINAGKVLENSKTVAESRSHVAELPGGIITMLVVVPPPSERTSDKPLPDNRNTKKCACTIL